MDLDEPVQVYKAWNSIQAHLLCNLLSDEGIQARVASDAVEAVRGEVPFQKASIPVWVAATDAERARPIVADYERTIAESGAASPEPREPFCYHCGQAVTAGQPACPHCGKPLEWSD